MSKNINKDKLEIFLLNLNEKNRQYAQKIIDNLLFVTTDELVSYVKMALTKAIEDNPLYNLYIPTQKIGSEHYIMLSLEKYLNPIKVLRYNEVPDNNFPIFILDDAIYSSLNMCSIVDEFQQATKCKNKFIAIVGFLSSDNVDLKEKFDVKIYAYSVLQHLTPNNLFLDYDEKYFYDNFACETDCVLPLFFEHKIANEFGAYQFIKNLLQEPINRKPIDDITWEDIDNFVRRLSILKL